MLRLDPVIFVAEAIGWAALCCSAPNPPPQTPTEGGPQHICHCDRSPCADNTSAGGSAVARKTAIQGESPVPLLSLLCTVFPWSFHGPDATRVSFFGFARPILVVPK